MNLLTSIRGRLLALTIATFLPFLGMVSLYLRDQAHEDQNHALHGALGEARVIASRLDDHLSNVHHLLLGASRAVAADPNRAESNDVVLRAIKNELPSYMSNLQLFDRTGVNIGTSASVERHQLFAGDRAYFQKALQSGRFSVGEPIKARSHGEWSLSVALPIKDSSGNVSAVLAAGTLLTRLHDIAIERVLPEGSVVTILNEHSRILGRSAGGPDWINRDLSALEYIRKHRGSPEATDISLWADGVTRLTASATARTVPWLVSVGLPKDTAFAHRAARLSWSGMIALTALMAALALAWFLSGRIIRPIRQLSRDAQVLGTGDLSHRSELRSNDELGVLAQTINQMAAALEDRESRVADEALERQRLEEQERQAKETLAAVIDASPVAIVCVAPDYKVLAWSRAAEQIFGYTAKETLGQPYKLVPPGAEAEFGALFERALNGEVLRDVTVKRRRKDGKIIDVSFSGAAMYDAHGKPRGVAYALNDITDRKKAEEQLRSAEDQLRQAQKMEAIGQLTGGLSHDFNNLLGIIIGNLDLLQSRIETVEARELLEEALDASLRGADLNRRLLAFARRQPLQPRICDLNEVVGSATQLLKRVIGEHIEIAVHPAASLGRLIVDPAQLEAALTNLAVNARDAMPNGGRLTVSTRNATLDADYATANPGVIPGEYVVLEVSDTGTGMPPEVLARVFEPFFTTKETGKGTGLGLSMVFGFVKQSGGHINIYSEVGAGTTLRIYLPYREGASEGAVMQPSAPLRRGNETILAVEDNEGLRRTLVKQLIELGYTVLEAGNGPQALAILAREPNIHLLLTDIVMPGGLNGWELAREAEEIRPDLKLLFTSGFPAASFAENQAVPADARLLGKPYRKAELAEKVREALAA